MLQKMKLHRIWCQDFIVHQRLKASMLSLNFLDPFLCRHPPPLQNITFWKEFAKKPTFEDFDGGDCLGGPKPIHESVGGKYKTWWGSLGDFLK